MELLITQFSPPPPFYLLSLRPKSLPQRPIVEHSQSMFFSYVTDHDLHPIKTIDKIIFAVIHSVLYA